VADRERRDDAQRRRERREQRRVDPVGERAHERARSARALRRALPGASPSAPRCTSITACGARPRAGAATLRQRSGHEDARRRVQAG
jgi:hypothetical protein